ncbi:MAG: stage II sporulation protein M [Planctomycetes bacterium]|nr:stage II sporulation protein M [Planctomycetota bacterium]
MDAAQDATTTTPAPPAPDPSGPTATAAETRSVAFRRARAASWRELETLLARVERHGARSLDADELARLAVLHRATISSLSVARGISLDRNLLEYLEALAVRSHLSVHAPRRDLLSLLARFFLRDFPGEVVARRRHVLASTACLLLGMLVGYAFTRSDLDTYDAFVSPDMADGRDPDATYDELREPLYGGQESLADTLVHFSAFLFTHNARVGMLAFALGILAGLPVIVLLFYNGASLGAMVALYDVRGLGPDFWAWVLPHGVTELFAIVLCGAGGLLIAQDVLFPGRHTRLANLRVAGRRAGVLLGGALAMLFVAGLVEGIFRQVVTSMPVRFVVADGFVLGWILYFVALGRRREAT